MKYMDLLEIIMEIDIHGTEKCDAVCNKIRYLRGL